MSEKPIRTKPEPYCPECGMIMKLRRPKPHQNWDAFWGCSDYPNCDGAFSIGWDGKPEEEA